MDYERAGRCGTNRFIAIAKEIDAPAWFVLCGDDKQDAVDDVARQWARQKAGRIAVVCEGRIAHTSEVVVDSTRWANAPADGPS